MRSPLRRTSITALASAALVEACAPLSRDLDGNAREPAVALAFGVAVASVRAGARGQVEFVVGPTYSADKGPVKPLRAGKRHSGDSRGTADRTATQVFARVAVA